jgi:hypothetical protein
VVQTDFDKCGLLLMAAIANDPPPDTERSNPLDRERFEFEREKWHGEQSVRREELTLKREEANRSRWINPLVIAILAAAVAGLVNVGVTLISSHQQLKLEREKATLTQSLNLQQSTATLKLEHSKSEAARILEVVKTNDPDKAAVNLGFLLDAVSSTTWIRGTISKSTLKSASLAKVSLSRPLCNLTSVRTIDLTFRYATMVR